MGSSVTGFELEDTSRSNFGGLDLGLGLEDAVLSPRTYPCFLNHQVKQNLFATKADEQTRNSRARNMSTGHKGSLKLHLQVP